VLPLCYFFNSCSRSYLLVKSIKTVTTSETTNTHLKYTVSVRALCEFTAKHGDLDLRFTPSPSAQEGIAGHAIVTSRRGADYLPELSLQGDYKLLTVRGRADGYDPVGNQLEEIKTFRGDLHAMPENRRNLHWAQVKIYGWLLCRERKLESIHLALVYFDIASLDETPLVETFTATGLESYFNTQCELFLAWAEVELAHRTARDAALTTLAFVHPTFRPGQRELAEAVYKTAASGTCLMAQATTGIGKTIGTVFPLLKVMPRQRLDKVFFLAAKTPGRRLALNAFDLVRSGADDAAGRGLLPLRVLELVARDKSCEHPDKACHGDSCPLAKGFYDRLPDARHAARQLASTHTLDRQAVRSVALAHRVCPYYLGQELVTWSDVVVGDYNYYFDTSALLHAATSAHQWRVSVLVDEAHNMVDRARSMYSAALAQAQLQEVHASAPKAVRSVLDKLNRAFSDVVKTQADDYRVAEELPAEFLKVLQQCITTITDFLVANPTRVDAELQAFYFEALHFSRMADSFAAHSMFDITISDAAPGGGSLLERDNACATLNIRNIVPAPFLNPRITAAHSVALFSATLSPPQFYKETLGLPDSTVSMSAASPFSPSQLYVAAVSHISTRYNDRAQSLSHIVELMARQYCKTPGNYLAFTSSYDYLLSLEQLFTLRHPNIPVRVQTRQMTEAGREEFLARFTPESCGIGFAVLGGAFAEGIDLPGSRLIGAFIATLGLPQINAVNNEFKMRMAKYFSDEPEHGGASTPQSQSADQQKAYNYTYLYPGLQKVVQAAGRVVRTPEDKGVIFLMDDRFNRSEVRALLPPWWHVNTV
jgi:DNA excision repair protein ERCC-2